MQHNNLKLKLLHLADVLRQETDEDNPLSTTDIIKKLAERGITVNRKTLYEDIELLKEHGLDIEKAHREYDSYRKQLPDDLTDVEKAYLDTLKQMQMKLKGDGIISSPIDY
jgi:biotin operon repressor